MGNTISLATLLISGAPNSVNQRSRAFSEEEPGSRGGPGHGGTCSNVTLRAGAGQTGAARKNQDPRWSSQGWELAQRRPLLNQHECCDVSWHLLCPTRHLRAGASWQVRRSEENRAFLKLCPRTTSLDIWGDEGWKRQASACSSQPVKALWWGGRKGSLC